MSAPSELAQLSLEERCVPSKRDSDPPTPGEEELVNNDPYPLNRPANFNRERHVFGFRTSFEEIYAWAGEFPAGAKNKGLWGRVNLAMKVLTESMGAGEDGLCLQLCYPANKTSGDRVLVLSLSWIGQKPTVSQVELIKEVLKGREPGWYETPFKVL